MMRLLCITIVCLILAGSAYSEEPMLTVKVSAELGGNITLPCTIVSSDTMSFGDNGHRIKWTTVEDDDALNEDMLVKMGEHMKTYGSFEGRVFLRGLNSKDASLIMTEVSMDDKGKYHCEVDNGMEDSLQEVILEVHAGLTTGAVFPYSPPSGRYNLNFQGAVQACEDQEAVIASHEQLLAAWKGGLDWCNAGWLSDGTVQYPITKPRHPCGGSNNGPGLRTYGRQEKIRQFDVFCYTTALKGHFYWLVQPERLTFDEAVEACRDDGAEIAKVGHMFAAWKLEGYDRCDAGWLADGSVRYPISRPRKNCSPTEAAVRFVGFPDKTVKSYGVYCYKPDQ